MMFHDFINIPFSVVTQEIDLDLDLGGNQSSSTKSKSTSQNASCGKSKQGRKYNRGSSCKENKRRQSHRSSVTLHGHEVSAMRRGSKRASQHQKLNKTTTSTASGATTKTQRNERRRISTIRSPSPIRSPKLSTKETNKSSHAARRTYRRRKQSSGEEEGGNERAIHTLCIRKDVPTLHSVAFAPSSRPFSGVLTRRRRNPQGSIPRPEFPTRWNESTEMPRDHRGR